MVKKHSNMNLLKVIKFRKAPKRDEQTDSKDDAAADPNEPEFENGIGNSSKSNEVDSIAEADDDDDDDDFIMTKVKRRLTELKRNRFMVLIPEEDSCAEDEEEEQGETSSGEWRDVEAEGRQWWGGFGAVYDKYCEKMLCFDRMIMQHLIEANSQTPSTPSPRSASIKLASPFRCLSLKKIEEPDDEMEQLQPPLADSLKDMETAYVAQICLSWEALHCQYTQLNQLILCQPENPSRYNLSAQQFQQFQVLLQRFIENEPFEHGLRAEIYARTRRTFPKMLQVPNIQGSDEKGIEEEEELVIHAPDLMVIIEASIFTFHRFLKMEKRNSNGGESLSSGNQDHDPTVLNEIRSSLDKKRMKLKEVGKKSRGWKQKTWPQTHEDIQLLFGVVDIKILSRVLRMPKITKEELHWCQQKMNKLEVSDGKLRRDASPILFPSSC